MMPTHERAYERLSVPLPVAFRGPKGFLEGATVNISRGGMFIRTTAPLPLGFRTFFRIKIESNPIQFHLEGEVIWQQKRPRKGANEVPRGMGVRFVASRVHGEKMLDSILSVLQTSISKA